MALYIHIDSMWKNASRIKIEKISFFSLISNQKNLPFNLKSM